MISTIEIEGMKYVLIPEVEYQTMDFLPPLPPSKNGLTPAKALISASIAREIIQERRELALTQMQLAELAGIRQETLSRLESGKHKPNARTIERIESALKRKRLRR